MRITGLETLVFGVDDVASGGRYEALDGTAIVIAHTSDAGLAAPPTPACKLRKTVMGVADAAALEDIAAELSRDREVKRRPNGSIESTDDSGFAIGFQPSQKRAFTLAGEISNAPGSPFSRPINSLGTIGPDSPIRPRSLSHVVYFVPDVLKAEAFYVNRLGFRCTDRFNQAGPFLQPGACLDHHTHFLIGAPPFMHGVEHFTFHFGGPNEMMTNGYRFVEKGYQAFWGPGRHILGSNWFWYFNSPFNCHMEMDADMDLHDASWKPRAVDLAADNSQTFLMKFRSKWMPGPGTHENGAYA